MKITALLRRYQRPGTEDWVGEGTIAANEPGVAAARAYADADSGEARRHGNPSEEATRPFGDHPFGESRVVAVIRSETKADRERYGPVRLALDPVAGQALEAKKAGRTGLAIHGGPTRDGALRATHGCLRVDDATAEALAGPADEQIRAGGMVTYVCEEIP